MGIRLKDSGCGGSAVVNGMICPVTSYQACSWLPARGGSFAWVQRVLLRSQADLSSGRHGPSHLLQPLLLGFLFLFCVFVCFFEISSALFKFIFCAFLTVKETTGVSVSLFICSVTQPCSSLHTIHFQNARQPIFLTFQLL